MSNNNVLRFAAGCSLKLFRLSCCYTSWSMCRVHSSDHRRIKEMVPQVHFNGTDIRNMYLCMCNRQCVRCVLINGQNKVHTVKGNEVTVPWCVTKSLEIKGFIAVSVDEICSLMCVWKRETAFYFMHQFRFSAYFFLNDWTLNVQRYWSNTHVIIHTYHHHSEM